MATPLSNKSTPTTTTPNVRTPLDWLPTWIVEYRREDFSGDLIAGIIVAVMLIPQGMAYALLAGLPPEVGLYASILPLIIYGVFGSSRTLSVAPVAMVSILVASGLSRVTQDPSQYLAYALLLAFMVGVIQLAMGLLKVGFLVNFLSHPVLAGFTNAAALVIGFSQLKYILGFSVPRFEHPYETPVYIAQHLNQTNITVLGIGVFSIAVLWIFKHYVEHWITGIPKILQMPIVRSAPLIVVVFGIVITWQENLDVDIVGSIPAGLPQLTMPTLDGDVMMTLLPIAFTISLVGFMESFSIAKVMASKKRQKIDANRELVALGGANLGAAFSGGYPVMGGLSRSAVNFSAGANTGLASIITAILLAFTLLFLTSLFFYLPKAVLAAIILVAITNLIETKTLRHTWHYSKADSASWIITFGAVLLVGIETGILVGVVSSLLLYLWRTSRPHIAVVGRVDATEHFRNIHNYEVQTCSHVLTIRVDESLYFANAQYLESYLLGAVADAPKVKHLVLVCSAVNEIDTSALDVLKNLILELKDSGVEFYLAEVKKPVYKRLHAIGFIADLGQDRIFLSTHLAMECLGCDC